LKQQFYFGCPLSHRGGGVDPIKWWAEQRGGGVDPIKWRAETAGGMRIAEAAVFLLEA